MGAFQSSSSDDDVLKALESPNVFIADVRSAEEFANGDGYQGAVNITVDTVAERLNEFGPDKQRNIITYCQAGVRAASAANTLRSAGFTHVYSTTNANHLREIARRIPK
jgi:rhodanese-related sulfurtransferase